MMITLFYLHDFCYSNCEKIKKDDLNRESFSSRLWLEVQIFYQVVGICHQKDPSFKRTASTVLSKFIRCRYKGYRRVFPLFRKALAL